MAVMDTSELQPAVKQDTSVKSRVPSPMSRSSPTNARKMQRRHKRIHKRPHSLRKMTLKNQHQKKTEERVKKLDIQLMFFLQSVPDLQRLEQNLSTWFHMQDRQTNIATAPLGLGRPSMCFNPNLVYTKATKLLSERHSKANFDCSAPRKRLGNVLKPLAPKEKVNGDKAKFVTLTDLLDGKNINTNPQSQRRPFLRPRVTISRSASKNIRNTGKKDVPNNSLSQCKSSSSMVFSPLSLAPSTPLFEANSQPRCKLQKAVKYGLENRSSSSGSQLGFPNMVHMKDNAQHAASKSTSISSPMKKHLFK
ncbi:unnamed protein product [Clavelina lepadiformis]|uniref:Uncharacterized protein n=1 Tax=Clavelina lepadiformis TaxID=159417 RepID=A0ABP0GME9_CLALP